MYSALIGDCSPCKLIPLAPSPTLVRGKRQNENIVVAGRREQDLNLCGRTQQMNRTSSLRTTFESVALTTRPSPFRVRQWDEVLACAGENSRLVRLLTRRMAAKVEINTFY